MKTSKPKSKKNPLVKDAFDDSAIDQNEAQESISLDSPVMSASPPDILVDN